MPPKKRGRKAATKTTPKSKSSAAADPSSPPPSPPSAAARSETPSTDPLPTSQTQSPVTITNSDSNPASVTPETPAVTAVSDLNPVSVSVTPDSDSNPVSAPETPAPNVNTDTNPVSVSETPAANADSELNSVPVSNEAPPVTGTKKKVVKVVKKIVKKKVLKPKAPTSLQIEKVDEAVEAVSETVTDSEKPVSVAQSDALNTVAETAGTEPMEEEKKEENLPVLAETGVVEAKKDEVNEVVEEKKEVSVEEGEGKEVVEAKKDEVNEVVEEKKEVSVREGEGKEVVGDEEGQISERQKRRRTEIFVGGLDRDAKEEDLRNVFGKVGEIAEVRMMMDGQTGKNKGYAFVRYKEAGQAKQAVAEFAKVEICGKLCGAAALEGNDTIFLGNIDKKWKKEDLIKVLQDVGIEKIDTVTVMVDPHNAETNRGFAFLELESNRDAQAAFKKLSKNDAFGEGLNIKVAWAEPLNDPDEDEMQKVKSVYVECVPSSWDEATLRESFNKFGEIERIVLSRNMPSAKRKDFAFVNYTTRDAALSCIESFDKEEILDDSLKAKLKVSLAKPTRKEKQNKGMLKLSNTGKVKTKPIQESKFRTAANNGSSSRGPNYGTGDRKFSMSSEFLHPQAAWQQGQVGYGRGPAFPDYSHGVVGGKRSYSAMGRGEVAPSYPDWRGFPRARFDRSYPAANSSYGAIPVPQVPPGPSVPYHQRPDAGYGTGPHPYGAGRPNTFQRQGFPHPPFGSNMYPRY